MIITVKINVDGTNQVRNIITGKMAKPILLFKMI
jgi:hypothetical protein